MKTVESLEMKTVSAHDPKELANKFNEWVAEEGILAWQFVSSYFNFDGSKFWHVIVYKKEVRVTSPNTIPNEPPEVRYVMDAPRIKSKLGKESIL